MKNTKNENERFSENEITIQDLPQKIPLITTPILYTIQKTQYSK